MSREQILALLDDPSDEVLIRLFDAGTRVLDPSQGWSSSATVALLQDLAKIISEVSQRG